MTASVTAAPQVRAPEPSVTVARRMRIESVPELWPLSPSAQRCI